MSLPLTRRIARTALLIAAGAAPVVGAAGAAGAAGLPQTADLGGLTSVEGSGLGKTVEGAAKPVSDTAGETGGKVVGTTLPVAGKAVTDLGSKAGPAAQKVTHGKGGKGKGGGLSADSLAKGLPLG